MKAKTQEAGTQVHIIFDGQSLDDTSLTMNMFTQNSIDVKIWKGKHKCIAQTFIDVQDVIRASEMFKEIYCKGLLKNSYKRTIENLNI